jgi:DNA-binding NarL/FixJ family response regulator
MIANLNLPKVNGLTIARRLLRNGSEIKLLIVTATVSKNTIRDLLRAGVHGIVSKADPASEFVDGVEAIQQNRTFFHKHVQDMILDGYLHPVSEAQSDWVLTTREQEVLQLLAEGATTKEIAIVLGITWRTAETHRHRLMHKLRLHNAAELTLYAISHDIVENPAMAAFTLCETCQSDKLLVAKCYRHHVIPPPVRPCKIAYADTFSAIPPERAIVSQKLPSQRAAS